MISLKLDHSHSHHLPCHPVRVQEQDPITIKQTDRQQLSDVDEQNEDYYYVRHKSHTSHKSLDANEFKTIQSRSNESQKVQIMPVKKSFTKKPISKLTPDDIYTADVMQSAFIASMKPLPLNIRALITQKQKMIQDKVYLGINGEGSNILQRIYQEVDTHNHLKDCIQQNLQDMMNQIQSNLQLDILNSNKYIIHKIIRSTKEDLAKNRKRNIIDPSGLTSQGLTFNSGQSGGRNFTHKDDNQSYASQSHQSQQDYSLKSQQTKKAEDFIKKIQKQQMQLRKRNKQQEQKKKSLEVRSMQEKKQFEEQIKNERKNYLKRRIQAKKQIKMKELQVRQKMNKQYKQFLKKYKNRTPLFKQKQQLFQKSIQDSKKMEQMLLQKRKQQKRSIDISQIIEHQKKYKQLKKQKQREKLNENRMKSLQQSQQKQKRNYYMSKFHEILAQQQEILKQKQIKQDPKLLRSELIKKRDLYAKYVREKYIPKSDEAKQKQLQQLLQKLQWTQKLKSGRLQPKQRNEAGNQYLKRIHQLINQLRSENKLPNISKSIDIQQLERYKQKKSRYKNYLQDVRPKRSYSIDYNRIDDMDLEDAQYKLSKLEKNAQRKQVYVNGYNFNIQKTMEEKKKIDDQYLQAVKVKLALINKFE